MPATKSKEKAKGKDKSKSTKDGKGKHKGKRREENGILHRFTARTADRHQLYQEAVQCPEAEIEFIDKTFKKITGRKARSLREDFCGTALLCAEWVKSHEDKTAVGVDNDPEVLQWGEEHNIAPLDDDQRLRVTLLEEDVRTAVTEAVDVLVAFNFSYYLFMTRKHLLQYFKSVRQHIRSDGIFMLDAYGGYEAQDTVEEERPCNGFSYVWDQAEFNPITHETLCLIHFHFPDRTSIKRAFSYRWRLWSLPEVREILEEAGFKNVTVYWEGTDPKTNEGNGVFKPTTKGEVCPGWIAYVLAYPA